METGEKGFQYHRKTDVQVLKTFDVVIEDASELENLRLDLNVYGKRADRSQKRLVASGSVEIRSMLYCSLEQNFSEQSYTELRYATLKNPDRVINSTAFLKVVVSPSQPNDQPNERTARFPDAPDAIELDRGRSNSRNPSIKKFDRSEINKTFEEIEKIREKRRQNRATPEEEERMKSIKASIRHTPEIRKYNEQSLDRSKDSLEIQRDCEQKSELRNDPKRRRDYIAKEVLSTKEPGDLKRFYSTRSENAYLREERPRQPAMDSQPTRAQPRPDTQKASEAAPVDPPKAEEAPKERKRRGVPEDQVENLRKEISSMLRGLEGKGGEPAGNGRVREASERLGVLQELRRVVLEEG
jgi:hypothetical protein